MRNLGLTTPFLLAPVLLAPVLLTLVLLAACGERATPAAADRRAPDRVQPRIDVASLATPVRIGEAGPAFRACQATGTTRNPAGAALAVRAGPFDSAAATGSIAPGARFHVCDRSIDQSWLGIVYEAAAADCGVSVPVASERDYAGPCRQGWVASAAVRLVAG